MKRRGWRVLLLVMMTTLSWLLAGCGNGGGGGGASDLVISLSSLSYTSIEPGQTVTGTLQLTATDMALNDVHVAIKTDAAELTGKANRTDGSGKATFSLTAAPNVSLKKTVNVWAELDGVRSSNTLQIELKSLAESILFNFTVPDSVQIERTVDAGTPAAAQSVVVTGTSVEFKGPGGVILPNPPSVTISVDRIDNWIAGDLVTLNGVDFTGTNPVSSTTIPLANVTGKADIPLNLTVLLPPAPAAGSSTPNTYAIYWRATVNYNGQSYTRTAATSVKGLTTGK